MRGAIFRSVLTVTPDEKSIVTASKTGELRLWDLDTGQPLSKGTIPPLPQNHYLQELAISRNGRSLAAAITAAGQESRIILWDIRDLFAVPPQSSTLPGTQSSSIQTEP